MILVSDSMFYQPVPAITISSPTAQSVSSMSVIDVEPAKADLSSLVQVMSLLIPCMSRVPKRTPITLFPY